LGVASGLPTCPICLGEGATLTASPDGATAVKCIRCGEFAIALDANEVARQTGEPLWGKDSGARVRLSAWARRNSGTRLSRDQVEGASTIVIPTYAERKRDLMLLIEERSNRAGFGVPARLRNEDVAGVAWVAENHAGRMVDLLRQDKLVQANIPEAPYQHSLTILSAGYQFLDVNQSPNRESGIAFVAMWFDASMNGVYADGVAPGIESAGYAPRRVDSSHFLGKVDDRIIMEIRRSRFVVADLTGHRQNVYFEGAFALGLGVPVLWTCREDQYTRELVHFDQRQYNTLVWREGELSECRAALQARIQATIGRGPRSECGPSAVELGGPRIEAPRDMETQEEDVDGLNPGPRHYDVDGQAE
jgi:hypothetical protein